jgi:hypothetical protein
MVGYLKYLLGWIKPKYNELTTYLTALTCILLAIVNPKFGSVYVQTFNQILRDSPDKAGLWFVMFSALAAWGLVLSIFHIFTKREKSAAEKHLWGPS